MLTFKSIGKASRFQKPPLRCHFKETCKIHFCIGIGVSIASDRQRSFNIIYSKAGILSTVRKSPPLFISFFTIAVPLLEYLTNITNTVKIKHVYLVCSHIIYRKRNHNTECISKIFDWEKYLSERRNIFPFTTTLLPDKGKELIDQQFLIFPA